MSNKEIIKKAKLWLQKPFDKNTQELTQQLINENTTNLTESFYKNLTFGTGGMRGIMGVGTNRINKYTLGKNTQGISNYLHKIFPNKKLSVAIAYDCRHNSKKFAKEVAHVFSANHIKVYLFKDLRPTPELSFAVKELKCDVGIVLTASHNPPEYNGYKVYFNDGAQIVPPQDNEIINEINNVNFDKINFKSNEKLIEYIGIKIDNLFIDACIKNGTFLVKNRDDVKIVFTSLHGTSITIIPEALKQAGFSNVHIVAAQKEPDGNFPTVKSPNPEEPEALKMAIDLANKINADIVIGTDPDCDRIGIAVRNLEGNLTLLNGNQAMSVMTNFLIKKRKEQGKLNGNQFVGSTIVSTNLVNDIATSYGIETKVGLTGFKWIAKMIRDYPDQEFIGGGEESFGFMVGDFVRDKDAVTATLLACEIFAEALVNNTTFYKELINLYIKHRFYKEHLIAVVKKGISGAEEIKQMMLDLRNNPLKKIDGEKVIYLYDYQSSEKKNLIQKTKEKITIPKSNVLIYETENGTKVAARPSGTEPKIKFYISVNTHLDKTENVTKTEQELDAKIQRIVKELL
ncbi:MAG: phospho-sugar mutase [Flavobacteriaceae bacterium]|nr:phospho-sugar mutase [Flavobacteriaceae bacterium]